jgi:hypothetical protein
MTKIRNILSLIRNIPTYLDWYWKWERVKADFDRMQAEWHRIGGIKANSGKLVNFVGDYSLLCVEYAKWTPTTLDDQIVKAIRYVITEHRGIVVGLIEWVQSGYEPQTRELTALAELASIVPNDDECGSPMMKLYIITALYQILRFLKSLDAKPKPQNVEPQPVKRPVLNFVRKFLAGRQRQLATS